jgi:hypothetical protein
VFAIVGGGGNNFWSNVSIPQNGVSGHIGFTGSGNENALAALTAPVFNYSRVDDLAPTVEGIAADVTGPTDADVINFTVRFSEPVSGFDAPADVTVDTTGGVTSSGVAITGGPIVYNVQVSGIDGNGSIGITVVNTGVQDAATNAMAAPASSSTIDIDNSTSVSEWLLLND